MIKQLPGTIIFPITWTIVVQVLLCLPGSTIPSGGLFDIPNLDKVVHFTLFGGFTACWCYYFYLRGTAPGKLKTIFFIVYLLTAVNGILLEFVQRDYIPNRSFDLKDIIADMAACSIGYGICNIKLIKTAG